MFKSQKSGKKISFGVIDLNIWTHASTNVEQEQVSRGVSVLCWYAAPRYKWFYGNLAQLGKNSISIIRSSSIMGSKIGLMSYQWRVSLYMVIFQNVV